MSEPTKKTKMTTMTRTRYRRHHCHRLTNGRVRSARSIMQLPCRVVKCAALSRRRRHLLTQSRRNRRRHRHRRHRRYHRRRRRRRRRVCCRRLPSSRYGVVTLFSVYNDAPVLSITQSLTHSLFFSFCLLYQAAVAPVVGGDVASQRNEQRRGVQLIVCVHGFQGNSWDLVGRAHIFFSCCVWLAMRVILNRLFGVNLILCVHGFQGNSWDLVRTALRSLILFLVLVGFL
jgi:hypothetical protein